MKIKKTPLLLLLCLAVYVLGNRFPDHQAVRWLQSFLSSSQQSSSVSSSPVHTQERLESAQTASGSRALLQAIEQKNSDVQVRGTGTVVKVLPDDLQGSKHQRFILKLPTGQTVLIAHNIDLAPKIKRLQAGDKVEFNGEFEWNERGGVVHWTHRDPNGRHESGWLQHAGKVYQ